MRIQNLLSIVFLALATMLAVQINALAQAQTQATAAKPMKKDEVSFSIARRLNALNESPVSAIVTELDSVIEVTGITMRPDGKAEVTVKEQAPSSAAFTNRSTRLLFTPPAPGDKDEKWTWDQFEENRRFYPVDRLFPYAQNELGKRKQATVAGWNAFIAAINKQGEAASKALETAKAVLKADPPPMANVTNVRKALTEAMKENKTEDILNAYRELNGLTEAINTLGDTYTDLKANDAYLRLIEEFKNSVNVTNAARKSYVQSVAAYNEVILRLPFGLVAYGLQFHKIEANVSEE
jgi:LemA protein